MKILSILILSLFLMLIVVCGLSTTYATVPHLINYQGRLTDKSGQSLDGSYKVTFRIYDAETGPGTMTPWEEIHPNVVMQKGAFSILLGSVKVLDLAFDKPYWLEIKVSDDVMSPRQQITSGGYALRADTSDKIVLSPEDTKPDYLNKKTGNSIKIDKSSFKFDAISSTFGVFGGDGSDGDVVISRNTDISNSAKQYNNLTIDPGVTLTAKNCIIGVKGNLTVKGMISVDGGGLPGGPGTPDMSKDGQWLGYNVIPGGSLSTETQVFSTGGGGGGGGASIFCPNPGGTSGGKGGAPVANGFAADSSKQLFAKYALKEGILFCVGAGGGGGGNKGHAGPGSNATGATGGVGGGALLVECGTFEGAEGSLISADGLPGGDGPGVDNGGGGGGGGTVVIRCRKITANDGVMRSNGGAPGAGGNPGTGGPGFTALVLIE